MDSAAAIAAKAYADFALTAALRSTRAYERYVQIVGCLARGQVSVEEISACVEQVAASRLNDLSSSVTELYRALFASLVSGDYLSTTGASGAPSDAQDATDWTESLMRHSAARDTAAVGDFFERLSKVATGDLTAKEILRETKAHYRSTPARRLATATEAWFDFLSGLETLRADLGDECLKTVLERITPGPAGEGVLELDAPSGQTASAEIVLENDHEGPVRVHCDVSEFRRADGVGAAFPTTASITPDDLSMAEGSSSAVCLTVHLDARVYEPDTPYVGILHIVRDRRARTDVPVRISASRTST